ncbi:MAG: cytochrome c3 family protein [Gemmatimonadaceae bacterium]
MSNHAQVTTRPAAGARSYAAVLLVGAVLLTMPAIARAQEMPTSQTCIACHLKQKDERLSAPARNFKSDIHAQKGFSCLDCHGNVTQHGADPRNITPDAGFLQKPDRRDIPAMCGRCHSDAAFMKRYNPMLRVDEVAEYRTSVHGKRLFEFGDTAVATCIDCHAAHGTLPPSDPASSVYPTHVATTCGRCHSDSTRMAPYGIPTNQVKLWTGSVHGEDMLKKGDLSAPTCNNCHGNHGATPPGVADVPHVCGQCHSTVAEFFAGNGHDSIFTANKLLGCVTCHGNHGIVQPSDTLLTARASTVCARCHKANDSAGRQFLTMRTLIDSLLAVEVHSRLILDQADNLGMDVSQAQFDLADVTTALTKARTAVHSFHAESVAKQIAVGVKTSVNATRQGRAALAEHRYRRIGLAISVPIILGLAGALWLRLRLIEADQPDEKDDDDTDDEHGTTDNREHQR